MNNCSPTNTRKVVEHYGITVSASTVRLITEGHGAALSCQSEEAVRMPAQGVGVMIAELAGSYIPSVEFGVGTSDQRKLRKVVWHEAKLCLARVKGQHNARYGATMKGIAAAGVMWRPTAVEAGAGRTTFLHCVGDGAKSIVSQVKEQFGKQAKFLLDFYHVSEYLAEVARSIADKAATGWLTERQAWLKESRAAEVIVELSKLQEAPPVEQANAPVKRSYRYLSERSEYSDYKRAIAEGLPIGSGEIKGGHRSYKPD